MQPGDTLTRQLVDLPLRDAAGLPVPEQTDGRSLLPRLRRAGDWPDDMFVQITESGVGRAVRTARWKYAVHAERDAAKSHGPIFTKRKPR